ncbi:MAG: hypothetical protein HOI55_08220 [Candidatus Marinimicrobia bacterium]|nr:hypothetical protein [Candidatus Neomarinimicrobiota bacterium]MDC0501477.1 hypothetical protein [Euryarchaeota archaeon]
MIEDLSMKDDIQLIIQIIENNGHNLDPDTILSLTNYIERNLSILIKIREILTGVTAYRALVLEEEEKIENLGGV